MKLKDWSNRLLYATMLISIVRYAAAFAASDVGIIDGVWSNVLTVALSITGLGMGILDTVGGGLLFNGWSKVFPKSGQTWSLRFKILTTCVFTLLLSGLFILVPFSMSRLAHESVLESLGGKESLWSWAWATMVNLIPYVLIAGVFTGNKMVSSLEEENPGKVSESEQKAEDKLSESFRKFPKDWRTLEPMLSYEQTVEIANLTAEKVKQWARGIGVSEKTITNWRTAARQKLGKGE